MPLAHSYTFCENLTRREAGNFYHAFRLLPRFQRQAMCALYSFMRIADDLADSSDPVPVRRQALASWRQQLEGALRGCYTHTIHPALHHTTTQYCVPPCYLEAVLDGVMMDLDTTSYATFADLYQYCYRVASAVGLACIHVWGFRDDRALEYAEAAGIAFQLTNILRDLGEDGDRGRVYLPRDELKQFGYDPTWLLRAGEPGYDPVRFLRMEVGPDVRAWFLRTQRSSDGPPLVPTGNCANPFRRLMQFQVERANQFYDRAWELNTLLNPPGRAVFTVMFRTYRSLLDMMVSRDYDVFSQRVRLSRLYKLWLAAQAIPVRLGWV